MLRTSFRAFCLATILSGLAGCPNNNGGNDAGGQDSGPPPPCTADSECTDQGGKCWVPTGQCYSACANDSACQAVSMTQTSLCHVASGSCYERCDESSDCAPLGSGLVCYPSSGQCKSSCTGDDQCKAIELGTRCDIPSGVCIPAKGCNTNSDCPENIDVDHYCYQFGVGCRCITPEANDAGYSGVCRRRKAPCEECTGNDECGSDFIFDPVGTCKALQGDSSGKKYCFQQKVGQCPCGMVDDGAGYCKPQSNSCEQVGCSVDKDCKSGSVCNTGRCLCEPRCRWDFFKKELTAPGCPPGTTCWVDQANLDPASVFYGAGRCRPACTGDADCAFNPTSNPYGGNKLACRAEILNGGGMSDKRCRAGGQCMDDLECPEQPASSVYLGYCDRGAFQCKTDCRVGTDPTTGTAYKDCRAPYACAADGGTGNICRLLTCVEQGGAAIACIRGQYCCGEDKDGVGGADPCPATGLGPDNCYDAPKPPFCTTCQSQADCQNVQLPSYLTGGGACANGSKSPSCSPLPMQCYYAGDRPTGGMGVNVCAPSTWNDGTRDSFGVGKDGRGCPAGYAASYFYPQLVQSQDNYCDTDQDCNVGTDAGRCAADLSQRLQDGGHPKACLCTAGAGGNAQCPNSSDGGATSVCKFGVPGQTVPCIESINCTLLPGNAYQAPGSPRYGCGL
jgi:hypothetical protein